MNMMFPKPTKKKRKKHKKSIMQPKGDRRCYLCMLLDGDFTYKPYLEEHHVLFGNTHAFAEAEELYREGVSQVQSYKDIAFRISRLEDQDERDVLFYRYIKGYDWWKIAQIMDYSERWIYELHGRALKKMEIS